ncbi:MAG: hypothetical protein QM780_10155 [Hyphomicrobium sp.]|uniref:hypothetical protein n=1 Tax=Hyphomicrobium sp. TaxID=82 RepID=UPI0039E70DCD
MMIIVIGASLVILLLAFLGYVESHWIAPGVLFVVPAPLVLAFLWNEPTTVLAGALLGLFVALYVAFYLGGLIRAMVARPREKAGFQVRQY